MSGRKLFVVYCPLDAKYERQVDLFRKTLLTIPTSEHPQGQADGQTAQLFYKGEGKFPNDEHCMCIPLRYETPADGNLENPELHRAVFQKARQIITEMLDKAVLLEERAVQRELGGRYQCAQAETL